MENSRDDNEDNNRVPENDPNNSLVRKITSRVSEFLPASLSKWWSPVQHVIQHEYHSDSDKSEAPPAKRLREDIRTDTLIYSNNRPTTIQALNRFNSSHMNGEPYRIDKNIGIINTPSTSGCSSMVNRTNEQSNVQVEKSVKRKCTDVVESNAKRTNRKVDNTNYILSQIKQPTCSSSSFGSPDLIDRTFTSEKVYKSPFFIGRTSFGGIPSYKRSSTSISPVQVHSSSTVKKETAKSSLSQTARRILSTLEHFSTPLSDARKIPRPTLRTPYSRPLCMPSRSDVLQMKHVDQLRQSTENARHTAYKIMTDQTHTDINPKCKMKTKIIKSRPERDTEVPEQFDLPNIPLPITTLPEFANPFTSIEIKERYSRESKTKVSNFKFSTPIILEKRQDKITPINSFVFSKPLYLNEKQLSESVSHKTCSQFLYNETPVMLKLKRVADSVTSEKSLCDIVNVNNNLIEMFKSDLPTWECDVCLIRNQQDNVKCVACNATRTDPKIEYGFCNQFKLTADKWECESCMLRNSNNVVKCAACSSLKPGIDSKKYKNNTSTGFGDKFKPEYGTWECSVCMLRNKSELSKCVACNGAKPGQVIKKREMERWKCSSCMSWNRPTKSICTCCEAPKPSAKDYFKPKIKYPIPSFKNIVRDETDKVIDKKVEPVLETKSELPSHAKLLNGPIIFEPQNKSSTQNVPLLFKNTNLNQDNMKPQPITLEKSNKRTIDTVEKENKDSQKKPIILEVINIKPPMTFTTLPSSLFSNNQTTSVPSLFTNTTGATSTSISSLAVSTPATNPLTFTSKATVASLVTTTVPIALPSFSSLSQTKPSFDIKTDKNLPKYEDTKSEPLSKKPALSFTFGAATTSTNSITNPISSTTFSNVPNINQKPTEPIKTTFEAKPFKLPANIPNGFSFNAESKPTSFSFGETKQPPAYPFGSQETTKPPVFAFGAPTQQSSGFQFGTTKPPSVFSFGPSKPEENVNQNPPSTATTKPPVFNFSASSSQSTVKPFSFGATSQPEPSASGSFSFGSTQQPAAAFDAKPVFNFTASSGLPTFSGQPTVSTAGPQRRMKKAVRRTQR